MGVGPSPLWINVDGEAGTGKSHFIAVLSTMLCDMAKVNSKLMPLA